MNQATQVNDPSNYLPYGTDPDIDQEEDELTQPDPFDPEDISIDTRLVSMDSCLRRLQSGTITLNPDFQRQEVWTEERRSQLIESLMLRIPLPMFYVSADEKSHYTVVDGLQRLSTIRSFILGNDYLASYNPETKKYDENKRGEGFRLNSLEFWKIYEGLNYNQLPPNIQTRILETEFQFTVINPGTPEEVRRNIFKRLNTGGMPLSSQEIRNALYLGPSTRLLNKLAEFPEFEDATGFSVRKQRMEEKELILRFLSFLIRDYRTYKKAVTIDTYLSDTMIILNAMPTFQTREFNKLLKSGNVQISDITIMTDEEIKETFKKAMVRAFALFGRHAFRKSINDDRRTPINKALFETWGVILSQLEENEFQALMNKRDTFLNYYEPIIHSDDIGYYISRDSLQTTSVNWRFETFSSLIKTTLE